VSSHLSAFADPSSDNVFNYSEVPLNQNVQIVNATFDLGGYQLYDTQGETIIVPFDGHNIYTMQFARTEAAQMSFVNQNGIPVLYVPRGGYLVNAGVPGSRWYPLSRGYNPSQPVYVGIAPGWTAFVNMGWYPNMRCYGGYYTLTPHHIHDNVYPMPNYRFMIGESVYVGWGAFTLYIGHTAPSYHLAIVNPDFYRRGARRLDVHDDGRRASDEHRGIITGPAFNHSGTDSGFKRGETGPVFNGGGTGPAFNHGGTGSTFNGGGTEPAFNHGGGTAPTLHHGPIERPITARPGGSAPSGNPSGDRGQGGQPGNGGGERGR